jgi:hypothetical protein
MVRRPLPGPISNSNNLAPGRSSHSPAHVGAPKCDSVARYEGCWAQRLSSLLARLARCVRWCTCRKAGDLAPVLSRYAMTRRRRRDFGRPAASIRLRTATLMAASVCCAAKPRAQPRPDQRPEAAHRRFDERALAIAGGGLPDKSPSFRDHSQMVITLRRQIPFAAGHRRRARWNHHVDVTACTAIVWLVGSPSYAPSAVTRAIRSSI